MEKKLDSYDKAWVGIERPSFKCEKFIKKRAKIKKVKKAGRLEDMKLIYDMGIRVLKFLILLNILVITGKML